MPGHIPFQLGGRGGVQESRNREVAVKSLQGYIVKYQVRENMVRHGAFFATGHYIKTRAAK